MKVILTYDEQDVKKLLDDKLVSYHNKKDAGTILYSHCTLWFDNLLF